MAANVVIPDYGQSNDRRFASIESTADFLAGEIGRATLTTLCGAGISRNSGLPLATDLAREVLKPLVGESREIEKILSPKFPFEAFVENFDHYLPVAKLLRLFSLGSPNTVHLLIGKLFRTGLAKVGFTTNFDLLIERGYACYNADNSQILRILSSEREIKDFGRLLAASGGPTLVKLHGTIDRPGTIKTTLSRVARKDPDRILAHTLKYLFSTGEHSTVLVAGYSCSDQFDIIPSIPKPSPDAKTIVHVQHPPENVPARYFETRPLSGPFEGYRGQTVVCDATSLLVEAWERLPPQAGPVVVTPVGSTEWISFIQKWRACVVPRWTSLGARSTAVSLELALAELLADRVSSDSGVRGFRRVASWAKENRDDLVESLAYEKIAECQMIHNKSPLRSYSLARKAIAILESKTPHRTYQNRRRAEVLGSAYYYSAAALRRLGRIKEAIRHAKRGVRWYRAAKYVRGLAVSSIEMALCSQELMRRARNRGDRAVHWRVSTREFNRALAILIRTGDKANEARCLNSLGQFRAIYSARDEAEWEAGVEDLKKALQLAQVIDNGRVVISCHVNLAEACKDRDRKTACEHLREAEQDPAGLRKSRLRKKVRQLKLYLARGH